MIKKLTYLMAIPSILFLGSCATTNQTVQQVDQNDDVYYSEARAKEAVEVIAQATPEPGQKSDYVTDEQLYGDAYYGDYAERIYRFRNNTPWRNYYSSIYNFYDPFYTPYNMFNPYGGPGINVSIGINNGFYNYNPWRSYGYNYGNNYWGPYSFYNPWRPYNNIGYYGGGYGGGYYGGYYGGGYYGNGYNGNVIYNSPNYRARPVRGGENIYIDRGAVNGGSGTVIRNGNGQVIQSRGRAERYGDGTTTAPAPRTSGTTRPETASPRPARVQQQQPQRQPERIFTAPRQETSGGSQNSGGGRSNDSGGGGGRPSRGN